MEPYNGISVGMEYWRGVQRYGLAVPIAKFGSGDEYGPLPQLILTEREVEISINLLTMLLGRFREDKENYEDMVSA